MAALIQNLRAYLADYCWRFAPMFYTRLARTDLSRIPLSIEISRDEVDSYLRKVFGAIANEFHNINFAKALSHEKREHAWKILENHVGFRLTRRKSTIEGSGRGVFVEKGTIPARSVVCLNPGTIYDPWDSILLQSLGNHFVLRCKDGVVIDGSDVRLSRLVHRSCSYRDYGHDVNDLTWLEEHPFNYLNIGQYINNEPAPNLHNVQYFELDIHGWPQQLRKFLPFAVYSPYRTAPLRVIVLISFFNERTVDDFVDEHLGILTRRRKG